MVKARSNFLVFICLACISICRGQDTFFLSKDHFLSILRTYHPVIRQADLSIEQARAGIAEARGAFDPNLSATVDRKSFDGKLYYSYFNPQFTIPVWYGLDINAGVEEVLGTRVTSEATIGKASYIGVKVPVNNLLFDSRRATLKQAEGFRMLSEAERKLTVNDLLYEALGAYWDWVRDYRLYEIISEAVKVNEERLQFVITEYEQGTRPAIDTIEALSQLQAFYILRNNAWLSFQNSGLGLSNYLWLSNGTGFEWNNSILPPKEELSYKAAVPVLQDLLDHAASNHPKLTALNRKADILEIEKRLKAQYLLPKLSVKGNLLSKGYNVPEVGFWENNYKLGIDFSVPLLFRGARGAYRAAQIKIQDNRLEWNNSSFIIQNKVKSYFNEVVTLGQQLKIYEDALNNTDKLYQGERLRFEIGESTLFLLNARQNKVLETNQKLIELHAKWHKSYAALLWASGSLY